MTTIYLRQFIDTGMFGTITIGSTKNDVIELLGKKYDFADCGETQIIKYGWYEFFYWTETGKIFGIQNDHLQADCINHSEQINFKNRKWTIDKWFLKENKNITFKQVAELLKAESIPFSIEPAYKGCDENIIRCIKSNVRFDFAGEYAVSLGYKKGKFTGWKEFKESSEDDNILNGIRLFKLHTD